MDSIPPIEPAFPVIPPASAHVPRDPSRELPSINGNTNIDPVLHPSSRDETMRREVLMNEEQDKLMEKARSAVLRMDGSRVDAEEMLYSLQKAVVHAEAAFRGNLRFHLICQSAEDDVLPLVSESLLKTLRVKSRATTVIATLLTEILQLSDKHSMIPDSVSTVPEPQNNATSLIRAPLPVHSDPKLRKSWFPGPAPPDESSLKTASVSLDLSASGIATAISAQDELGSSHSSAFVPSMVHDANPNFDIPSTESVRIIFCPPEIHNSVRDMKRKVLEHVWGTFFDSLWRPSGIEYKNFIPSWFDVGTRFIYYDKGGRLSSITVRTRKLPTKHEVRRSLEQSIYSKVRCDDMVKIGNKHC